MALADKFQTDDFNEITKITDKTKLSKFFVLFSMLNFSSTPMLAIFSSQLICFAMIFATDYDNIILNIIPFCLVFGAFLLCLATLGTLYKLLIAPIQEGKQISLCNHQIAVCIILAFIILLFGIFPDGIFNQIATNIGIETY
jgi:NADH:ubiquinone oxidoreductase subunit 4 (subunit M)